MSTIRVKEDKGRSRAGICRTCAPLREKACARMLRKEPAWTLEACMTENGEKGPPTMEN